MDKDLKNICYIPFNELYIESMTNKVASCCLQKEQYKLDSDISDFNFLDNSFLEKTRNQFLSEEFPESCIRCKKLEDDGFESYRIWWNKIRHPDKNLNTKLQSIDVRLSNKCNLQCKMCNENFSDQIAKNMLEVSENSIINYSAKSLEKIKHALSPTDNLNGVINLILKNSSIKSLRLAGGEPFIMPEVEKLLDALILYDRTDINLHILTNCTSVKPRFLEKLELFNRCDISLSIDGVGKWIEYQRFPSNWISVEKNFHALGKFKNFRITINPCFSQLNLLGLADFLDWCNNVDYTYLRFNEVTFPTCLNWKVVPLKYRQELIDRLSNVKIPVKSANEQYEKFISMISTESVTLTDIEKKSLKELITLWDYNNNIKYKDMCPWYHDIF
jgi:molybdenum cofactor biosynthesis enzyme MoaA